MRVDLDGAGSLRGMSAPLPAWVEIRDLAPEDGIFVWDCLCSAYEIADTLEEITETARVHGEHCAKGQYRWEDGWR